MSRMISMQSIAVLVANVSFYQQQPFAAAATNWFSADKPALGDEFRKGDFIRLPAFLIHRDEPDRPGVPTCYARQLGTD